VLQVLVQVQVHVLEEHRLEVLVLVPVLVLEEDEGQELAWDHHSPKPGTR